MASRANLVYGVVKWTRPVVMASARVVGASWGAHGITVAMRAALEIIEGTGPVSVPQLARVLDITRQAAQRTMGDLADAGLVEARPNPAHRRSPLYDLTTPGREIFGTLHADELGVMASMASEFDAAELDTARRVLEALHRDIAARSVDPALGGEGDD